MTLTTPAPDTSGSADRPTRSTARSRARAAAVATGLTTAAFVASLLASVVFVVPVILVGLEVESTPVFVALTVVGQLVLLAVGLLYAWRYGVRIRIARPTTRHLGVAAVGTLAALTLATGLALALNALGLLPESVIGDAAAADPTILLWLAVLSVVLVAPAEEFLFRGVIQGRLRRAFGPVGAVAGSSLLFGSMHLVNYSGSVASVVAGALLIAGTGAVLGALYERTRNLAVPVLTHALYNVVLFGASYLG